jgi:hypothetical protein
MILLFKLNLGHNILTLIFYFFFKDFYIRLLNLFKFLSMRVFPSDTSNDDEDIKDNIIEMNSSIAIKNDKTISSGK